MRCGGTGLDCHTITNAPHAIRATGGVIAFMRPCRDAAFNGDTLHGGHRPPPIFIGPYRARKQVIPTMIGHASALEPGGLHGTRRGPMAPVDQRLICARPGRDACDAAVPVWIATR